MKIKLKNDKIVSEEKILTVQASMGCQLSDSLKSFVQINDGAEPDTSIFKIGEPNECGVNRFIPLDQILKERTHIENIRKDAYPVAWAEGGNYVLIDEARAEQCSFGITKSLKR